MLKSISSCFAKLNAKDYVKIGEKNEWHRVVYPIDTYDPTGKPGNGVLSTSKMIDDLEGVATEILTNKKLVSVGFLLDIKHVKPIGFGQSIKYNSEVVELNGNKIKFNVSVSSENDGSVIGCGTHTRAIIGLE